METEDVQKIGCLATVIGTIIAVLTYFNIFPSSNDESTEETSVVVEHKPQPLSNSTHKLYNTNHECVDLGLSVEWASCNIGANDPEEIGDYFAWGETEKKSEYNKDSYKLYNWAGIIKYNPEPKWYQFFSDGKNRLDFEDDAARVNWGGNWRIPTLYEWEELNEKCTFSEAYCNGELVCKVTGPNGNYIYIPFTGHVYDVTIFHQNLGWYWSSNSHSETNALLNIIKSGEGFYSEEVKYYGLPIRPCLPKFPQ